MARPWVLKQRANSGGQLTLCSQPPVSMTLPPDIHNVQVILEIREAKVYPLPVTPP